MNTHILYIDPNRIEQTHDSLQSKSILIIWIYLEKESIEVTSKRTE